MELRHLRYFVAVAEELHFTRAAERLCIGQPPLSQQIQALEAELGVELFQRNRRRVTLTDAGQRFFVRAQRILGEAAAAVDEARQAGRGELGELRIGFFATFPFTDVLPTLLQQYRQRYPQVRLALEEMFTTQQFEALAAGRLDISFARPVEMQAPEGVALREIHRDPLLAVLNVRHPLAGADSVSLAQLRDDGFIFHPPGTGTRLPQLVRQLCHAAGFEPKVAQEAREATTQVSLVAAGLGVAILPAPMRCVQIANVRYVPVSDAGAFLSLVMATRAEEPAPLLANFIALVETP